MFFISYTIHMDIKNKDSLYEGTINISEIISILWRDKIFIVI